MPWNVEKRDSEFCVIKESDNSVEGCHPTQDEANDQMAALYASESKDSTGVDVEGGELLGADATLSPPVEGPSDSSLEIVEFDAGKIYETEKAELSSSSRNSLPDSAFMYVEPGGKKDKEGRTTPRSLRHLPIRDGQGRIDLPHLRNAISRLSQSETGKGWLSTSLRARLLARARSLLKRQRNTKEEQTLVERVTMAVKEWLNGESGADDPEPLSIWKEADGTYHWLAIYSNNYRDDDGIPEIISAEAHRDFVKAVDAGEWPMPEFRYWHIPIARMGQANLVAYDDVTGFAIAAGAFDKGMESVAENLSKRKDHLVSHGMPVEEIRREESDPTILTRYRSSELGPLPGRAAANKLTGSFITSKEDDSMAIDEHKLEALADVGFDVAALTEKLEEGNAQAEEEQRDSKELETEEEVKTKGEVEETETETDIKSKDERSETDPVDTSSQTESEDKEVEPEVNPLLELAQIFKEVVAEAVAPLSERLDTLEAQKQTEDEEEKEAEEMLDEYTPAASWNQFVRSAVLGEKEAQIDGRTKEAQGPKETPVPTRSRTGMPMNTFLDEMLNADPGKENEAWRDAMGVKKN